MEHLRVTIELDGAGCLSAFSASGHAGSLPAGVNVACAAASILLGTAARMLVDAGLAAGGEAPAPGEMSLRIGVVAAERREWLRGVTAFLVRGLSDVAGEYPDKLSLRLS